MHSSSSIVRTDTHTFKCIRAMCVCVRVYFCCNGAFAAVYVCVCVLRWWARAHRAACKARRHIFLFTTTEVICGCWTSYLVPTAIASRQQNVAARCVDDRFWCVLVGWLVGWCTMPECRYYIGHSGCNYHIRTNCKCDVPGYNGALMVFRHALHGVANAIGRKRKFTNCIVKKTVYYMTNGARTIYYQGHTCAQSHTHTRTHVRTHTDTSCEFCSRTLTWLALVHSSTHTRACARASAISSTTAVGLLRSILLYTYLRWSVAQFDTNSRTRGRARVRRVCRGLFVRE